MNFPLREILFKSRREPKEAIIFRLLNERETFYNKLFFLFQTKNSVNYTGKLFEEGK